MWSLKAQGAHSQLKEVPPPMGWGLHKAGSLVVLQLTLWVGVRGTAQGQIHCAPVLGDSFCPYPNGLVDIPPDMVRYLCHNGTGLPASLLSFAGQLPSAFRADNTHELHSWLEGCQLVSCLIACNAGCCEEAKFGIGCMDPSHEIWGALAELLPLVAVDMEEFNWLPSVLIEPAIVVV